MTNLSNEQISNLMDDIGFLKKAIQKNTPIIQQIAITKSIRLSAIFTGLAIIALSIVALFIKSHFGSYFAAPQWVKLSFLGTSIVAFVIGSILKGSGILREAYHVDPKISLGKIALQLYSQRLIHAFLPLLTFTLFIIIICLMKGYTNLIVPVTSIGIGFALIFDYVLLQIKEYLFIGYWDLVIGCVLILVPSIGAEIGLILTLGLGMLFVGIYSYLIKNDRVTPEGK